MTDSTCTHPQPCPCYRKGREDAATAVVQAWWDDDELGGDYEALAEAARGAQQTEGRAS